MNFNIRGENLEITPALRDYVEKKIGRMEKYFNDTPSTDVNVRMSVKSNIHKVEVTIPMTGLLLRAEENHTDMYAAIDLVIEKLERQIRKYKTKINRKLRQDNSLKNIINEAANGLPKEKEEEDSEFEIVRVKRFNLKPMDAEEAILQMDLLGHNFFVFSNAESGETNVVYKRKDGRYGLIEPEA